MIDRRWLEFALHHLLAEPEELLFGFGLLRYRELAWRTRLLVVLVCGVGIVLEVLIFTLRGKQPPLNELFNYVFLLLLEHFSQRGLPIILLSCVFLGLLIEYLNSQVLVVSGVFHLCG